MLPGLGRISRRCVVAMLAVTAASPMLPRIGHAATTAAARLRALLDASEAAARRLDPTPSEPGSRQAGDAVLPNPLSDEYFETRRANAAADLEALREIDVAELPEADRVAHDAFQYQKSQELERFRSGIAQILRRVPLNATSGLHVQLADYVSGAGAPFGTVEDYRDGLQRIREFAGYLDTVVTRLQEGVASGHVQSRAVVLQVLGQLDAMLALKLEQDPFYSAIARMPAGVASAERKRLTEAYRRAIESELRPALARLGAYLRTSYLQQATQDPGRIAMKDGAALYAADLAHHTTLAIGAESLHSTGVAEVARIRSEMEAVRREIGFSGSLAAFFEHIRTEPRFYFRRPEDLLGRFEEIEARIWRGIPRLFARSPRAPFEVRALPAIGDHRSTGYYRPGPPDGVSPGVLWFNMALLGTRPIPTLETLTLHEGIPGHHFQITLAREDRALPATLRFGGLTAYSEGWGLYAESLGPELGMFTDPYQRFGHLDMEMLRAVRLVVDTGLHALRWSRQRAIDYMLDNTSMAQRDVAVEIDRYISWPGQACAYKPGALKIAELRARAARSQRAAFDIRAFHAQVIDTGAVPLAVLEAKIDRWLGVRAKVA